MMVSEMLKIVAEAMDRPIIDFDHEDIDKFIAQGADIKETELVTSFKEMSDIGKVRTKHGILEVVYNSYLPPQSIWLVRKPASPTQTL